MEKVAIIILHYGNPKITDDCLDSLQKIKLNNYKVDIYVLDNQGTINRHDNRKNTIFKFTKNYGFAGGNNRVVKKIIKKQYEYLLFLNNDTLVYPDFLIHLIKALENNDDIGICGPVIEHKVNDKTYYDYGGIINWVRSQPKHINSSQYCVINSDLLKLPNSQSTNFTKDWNMYRDFVSGCCMLIKTDLFRQLNGFQENYFMYLEDVDLCVRAKKLGYKTVCVPKAKIFHLGSQSASVNFKIKQSLKNGIRFTLSHAPKRYLLTAIIFNLVFYPMLWLRWKIKAFVN